MELQTPAPRQAGLSYTWETVEGWMIQIFYFFTYCSTLFPGRKFSMARVQKQKLANAPVRVLFAQKKTVIGRMQILTASGEIFNHVDEELPMWSGHGDRDVTVDVIFDAPFAAAPAVTLGLTGIDSAYDQNLRVRLITRNVTATGFTIECSTWHDTHIASAEVSWQAIGAVKAEAAAETVPKP